MRGRSICGGRERGAKEWGQDARVRAGHSEGTGRLCQWHLDGIFQAQILRAQLCRQFGTPGPIGPLSPGSQALPWGPGRREGQPLCVSVPHFGAL